MYGSKLWRGADGHTAIAHEMRQFMDIFEELGHFDALGDFSLFDSYFLVVYRIKRQHKGLHKGVKMEVPTILKVFCSKLLLYNE